MIIKWFLHLIVGYEVSTDYTKRVRRNIGGFDDDVPRSRIRAGSGIHSFDFIKSFT